MEFIKKVPIDSDALAGAQKHNLVYFALFILGIRIQMYAVHKDFLLMTIC